jgi:CheY-like chemotaxis protein
MDIQMPEMDGYEATRRIRARERKQSMSRLPIAAVTAHALPKERERCLEAGMDGYVSKPLDPRQFYGVLLRLIPPGLREPLPESPDSPDEPAARVPPELPGLDLEQALRLLGSKALFVSMLHKFRKEFGNSPGEFAALLDARDLDTLHRRAHTAKGLAANLGAEALRQAALDVELAAEAARDVPGNVGAARYALRNYATALEPVLAAAALCSLEQPGPAPVGADAADAADVRAVLERLAAMTGRSEMDALDFFAQHKDRLASVPDNRLQELEARLQDYDLDKAHVLLRAMLDTHDHEAGAA